MKCNLHRLFTRTCYDSHNDILSIVCPSGQIKYSHLTTPCCSIFKLQMIIYNLDGCGCQLNDPIMSPSYNQVISDQDKPIKVVKVTRTNEVGVPCP